MLIFRFPSCSLFYLPVFSASVHQRQVRNASTFHLHVPPFKRIYYNAFGPLFSGLLTEKLARRIAWHARQPFRFFFLYLATQFFSRFFVVPLLLALSVGHALILTWLKSRGLSVVWSWVVDPVAGSDVVCLAAPEYSSECHKSAQHFKNAPYMLLLKIT